MNISISEDLLDVLIETHERSFNIVEKYISKKNILYYKKCYHFLQGEVIILGKIKDYIK